MPSIDQFTKYLQDNPIQRTNRFQVSVQKPGEQMLTFFAESVTLPGRSLATLERRTMGKVSQGDFPYEQLYSGDLDMNIVMTEAGGERSYFEDWMDLIINGQGSVLTNRLDYIGDMKIGLLGTQSSGPNSEIVVREVFPKSIGSVTMSNAEENSYGILPIGLSFRDYEWLGSDTPPTSNGLH